MFDINDPYLFKTIRADEEDFFREFVLQMTRTSQQQQKFILRKAEKKAYTVDATGVYKRSKKRPQYTSKQKLLFSKATSTSLSVPEVAVPVFGHNRERNEKLVGVMFGLSNVLFTKRFFIYDAGTVGRPYDHWTEKDAKEYFIEKTKGGSAIVSMNTLPGKDKTQAEDGKIYLSWSGACVFRDSNGVIRELHFPANMIQDLEIDYLGVKEKILKRISDVIPKELYKRGIYPNISI